MFRYFPAKPRENSMKTTIASFSTSLRTRVLRISPYITTTICLLFGVLLFIGLPPADVLLAQNEMNADTASIMRGRRIFEKRCVMCHGSTGKGDGIRAMALTVRPANLSTSKLSDAEKALIIEKGGAAVGRSPLMPVWGNEFSRKEIQDLVKYLRAINILRK